MKRLSRFALLGALAALAFAPAAGAIPGPSDPLHPHLGGGDASALPHPGVNHSPNMNLLFNSQNPSNATNSDIAFWGNRAYQGDYGGFRIFDISNPAAPALVANFRCLGAQNDPVVWQNRLVFLAVDAVMAGPNCGAAQLPVAQWSNPPAGAWEGVRVIDVSDPANIRQVAAVYSDCGAHTIAMHPAGDRVHLYVSSYPLRPGPTCGDTEGPRAGRSPTHDVIQVIEVPLNNPAAAREVAEPRIVYPGDPDNQHVWGQHGLPSPPFEPAARACHDMTVFVEVNLIAAACAEQGQLWRIGANGIPDTQNPIWVFDDRQDANGATRNPEDTDVAVDFWHSATFSWDAKIVNFIDESFGVGCPPVTNITEPGVAGMSDTGRSYFVRTATGAKLSHFMIPRTESAIVGGEETCYNSAHLGNVAPTIGRYLLVNAWYMGGADVVDFTNPAAPSEVAYWDFLPGGATGSDNWSHYWYENTVGDNDGMSTYGTDGVHNPATGRGFEAFRVTMPTQDIGLSRLNPQTQESRISCRVTARGASLRAGVRRTLTLAVRARGAAVLPGQGFRAHATLRGAGVSKAVMTNASGNARTTVRPTRRGTIRITVHNDENLVGCSARRGVFGAAAAGGRLTGSR